MLKPPIARAADQIGIGQGCAVLNQDGGHHGLIAQQQAHERVGDFGQVCQPFGHPLSLLDRGFAQHLDHQIAGHGPFKAVDAAAGQANDIGQTSQEGLPGLPGPLPGIHGGINLGLKHNSASLSQGG